MNKTNGLTIKPSKAKATEEPQKVGACDLCGKPIHLQVRIEGKNRVETLILNCECRTTN